jgi:hypothetical protein
MIFPLITRISADWMFQNPRPSAKSAEESVIELDLWIEVGHDFSSQRARSSKEVTEADAFLCDLDPNLCALCVSTPLLWLRLRRTRTSVTRSVGEIRDFPVSDFLLSS